MMAAAKGPHVLSINDIRPWLVARGVQIPSNISTFVIYSSLDGQLFYLEGLDWFLGGSPYLTQDNFSVGFRAVIYGETAAYWTRANPSITYVGNLYGERITCNETCSNQSPYYSCVINNALTSNEWVRLDINDKGVEVDPLHTWNNVFDPSCNEFPAGSFVWPPWANASGAVQVSITNSLGILPTTVDGQLNAVADSYFGPGGNANYTGIIDSNFMPSKIVTGSMETDFSTPNEFGDPSDFSLSIAYPSGLVESFQTAPTGSKLTLWDSDPYFTAEFAANGTPNRAQYLGHYLNTYLPIVFSDYYISLCGSNGNDQRYNRERGVIQITTQESPGTGETILITQVVPTMSCNSDQFLYPQPNHVTNILTYPTLQVRRDSPYRGVRLVHAPGSTYEPLCYLFFSAAIIQEQRIYGAGAPYDDFKNAEQGFGWEPSDISYSSITTYDGWQLKSWLNPSGNLFVSNDYCPVAPVPTAIVTVETAADGTPSRPMETMASGDPNFPNSWDDWGPCLFDHWVLPVPSTPPQVWGPGVVPNGWYSSNTCYAGGVRNSTLVSRKRNPVTGLLQVSTKTVNLSGANGLVQGVPSNGDALLLSTTAYRYEDSLGRVSQISTTTGHTCQTEDRTYSGTNPQPDQIATSVTVDGVLLPFSGQLGHRYTYDSVANHFWKLSETDLLTGHCTTFDLNILGQPRKIVDVSSGITTSLTYDDHGQKYTETRLSSDANFDNLVNTFTYDYSQGLWAKSVQSSGSKSLTRVVMGSLRKWNTRNNNELMPVLVGLWRKQMARPRMR